MSPKETKIVKKSYAVIKKSNSLTVFLMAHWIKVCHLFSAKQILTFTAWHPVVWSYKFPSFLLFHQEKMAAAHKPARPSWIRLISKGWLSLKSLLVSIKRWISSFPREQPMIFRIFSDYTIGWKSDKLTFILASARELCILIVYRGQD